MGTHDDLAVLQAGLDANLAEGFLSESSLTGYKSFWRKWERHCASIPGAPPALGAPFYAFTALISENRETLSVVSLDLYMAAVIHEHRKAGLVPAHKQPANVAQWQALRRGFVRDYGARGRPLDNGKAVPMLRDDVAALLTATAPRSPMQHAMVAAFLLNLDAHLWPFRLAAITTDDVDVSDPSGAVRIGDITIPCDHVERVRGVPWDCTACAARAALATAPTSGAGAGLLLGAICDGTSGRTQHKPLNDIINVSLVRVFRRRFAHLTQPDGNKKRRYYSFRPDATTYDIAGVRRAAVLMVGDRHGLPSLMTRAWCAITWTSGARMYSDLADVQRGHIVEDPDGRGFSIHLGRTKTDQAGARGTVLTVGWDDGSAQPVAEYLCCRDACVGREGPALLSTDGASPTVTETGPAYKITGARIYPAFVRHHFARLINEAGLSGKGYTPYSLRRGNATQRDLDRQTLAEIQHALGHVNPQTTVGYVEPDGARAQARLMKRLADDER